MSTLTPPHSEGVEVPRFTPGPWSICRPTSTITGHPGIESDVCEVNIVIFGDRHESDDAGVRGRNYEESEANARLIATAPELYEALACAVVVLQTAANEFEKRDFGNAASAFREYAEKFKATISKATSPNQQEKGEQS